MNIRLLYLLPFALIATSLASCIKQDKTITTSFYSIYRVSGFNVDGQFISPICDYVDSADIESRNFYAQLDSSLTFQVIRTPYTKVEHQDICAIDWRIISIDIVALERYDENHPAGNSLNDIMSIEYTYKGKEVLLPLSEVHYGSIMLSDYYPYDPDFTFLYLRTTNGREFPASFQVKIQNAFGNELTCSTTKSHKN